MGNERIVSLKKNTILNVIKRLLQIAFPMLTFPYISRVLGIENFGKYNFSLSIIGYFSLIAGMGVNSYAVREGARIRDNKNKLEELISNVFTINMISTILAYIFLVILSFAWKDLAEYRLLLAVQSLTIISITIGVDYINIIYEDYSYMTKRYVFAKSVLLILMFILVRDKEDYILYAIIVTFAEILANLINIIHVHKYCSVRFAHKGFGLFVRTQLTALLVLFANSLAITVYSTSDITMLGIFSTVSSVGMYSLTSKIYQIAKSVLNAVVVVVIPRLAWSIKNGQMNYYNRLLNKTIRAIIAFSFPVIAAIFVMSKEIITIIGGEEYASGNGCLRVLLIALFPACLSAIFFDGILIVNRREKYCLISTLVSAGVNVVLNLYFIPMWGAMGASITTLIAELINCSLCIFFSRGFHNSIIELDRDFISVLVGTFIVIGICDLAVYKMVGFVAVLTGIITSIAGYTVCLYCCRNSIICLGMNSFISVLRRSFIENEN